MFIRSLSPRFKNVLLILLLQVFIVAAVIGSAGAQEGNVIWSDPANLSQAGSSSSPQIVLAADGTAYVLWLDSFTGYVYTHGNGAAWTAPEVVYLPVYSGTDSLGVRPTGASLPVPTLASGADDRIHALWRERDGQLFHSWVNENDLSSPIAWSPPQVIAEASLAEDIAVDRANHVHAVFVRPLADDQFPAGIYYRQSRDGGISWNPPMLLFESSYLRSTPETQAHVSFELAESNQIIISFDNRLQGRLYTIQSTNSGSSWGPIIEVDSRRPEDLLESVEPQSIQTVSSGEILHRYWLAGHDNVDCAIYGQVSRDNGDTWLDTDRLFADVEECPSAFHLLNDPEDVLIMLIETGRGLYLSVFDGEEWGDPEYQEMLTNFTDPQTFRPVTLGCLKAAIVEVDGFGVEPGIVLVGCDDGDGDDIWVRTRPLPKLDQPEDTAATSLWSPVSTVAVTTYNPSNLILVPDADGLLHAFWGSETPVDNEQKGIYYSHWDGLRWSQPSLVLTSPTGAPADRSDIAVDTLGRLTATWGSDQPGNVFYSQASTSRAALMSEWLAPIQLPINSPNATEPQLGVDRSNAYYIAYTIPLNEERGVYLVISSDGGSSWQSPLSVFDAVEAGWETVSQPRLAIGIDGTLHILWTRRSLPPENNALSLFYSRSTDAGLTWSEPEEISTLPVVSSNVTAIGDRIVHIVWLDENRTIWHQTSSDAGESWTRPLRVSSGGSIGPIDVAVDGAGQFHLINLADAPGGGNLDEEQDLFYLRHWSWSGDRWTAGETLEIDSAISVRGLSGAITPGGDLTLLFSGETVGTNETEPQWNVFFSNQQLILPSVLPTPLPPLTPIPTEVAVSVATFAPTPTPRVVFSSEADQGGVIPLPVDRDNPLSSSLLGIIPAGLVVLIVFFVGVRVLRRERHKNW